MICKKGKLNDLVDASGQSCVDHIVYPHRLFQMLFTMFREECKNYLGARTGTVLDFWQSFYNTPAGREISQRHPALIGKLPEDLLFTIPLIWHCDAAPCAKRRHT